MLAYAVRYSQAAQFGGGMGDWQTGTISGSLSYTNGSQHRPFSVQYGGGYNATISGPSYGNGVFQHLMLSQGLDWRRWNFCVTDSASVTPQAPTFGFTGIPGIGEPIAVSNPTSAINAQSILTVNTQVVDNDAGAQISRVLNHTMQVDFGVSNDIYRYPDGEGLNTNTNSEIGGLRWRLNTRNSLTSDYRYVLFSYPDLNFSFRTQSFVFGVTRAWTRRISTEISVGPQWINSSVSAVLPASTGTTVNAGLSYQSGYKAAGINYTRGVNSGAGFYLGAKTDAASVNYSHRMGRHLTLGSFISYMRTAGLSSAGVTNAKYGGIEVTHRLGKHLSLFANYSATTQSSSSALPGNTLRQMFQSAGFGIEYSPRTTRLER